MNKNIFFKNKCSQNKFNPDIKTKYNLTYQKRNNKIDIVPKKI